MATSAFVGYRLPDGTCVGHTVGADGHRLVPHLTALVARLGLEQARQVLVDHDRPWRALDANQGDTTGTDIAVAVPGVGQAYTDETEPPIHCDRPGDVGCDLWYLLGAEALVTSLGEVVPWPTGDRRSPVEAAADAIADLLAIDPEAVAIDGNRFVCLTAEQAQALLALAR